MDTRSTMKRLNELLVMVESSYLAIARKHDLSYNALMMLLMVESYETLTQKQVCDALYLPKSSVHTMLKDLIDREYLLLTEGGNKKEKYIVPTEAGKAFIQKVSCETETIENGALKSISERDMSKFLKIAEVLADHMVTETEIMYGRK